MKFNHGCTWIHTDKEDGVASARLSERAPSGQSIRLCSDAASCGLKAGGITWPVGRGTPHRKKESSGEVVSRNR